MYEHCPPPPCECSGYLYTVQPCDTLFLIAQRHCICLKQIIEANPQIKNPDLIFPGQVICIPKGGMREHLFHLSADPAYHHLCCGGVLWIKHLDDRCCQVMVMGTNLPEPDRCDRYTARFDWDGGSYEMPMSNIMSDPVWFGFGVVPFLFPPAFFIGGRFGVFPGPILFI